MRTEYDKSFGVIIKRMREKKGLSLREVQAATGISSSYMFRIENGERRSPSIKMVFTLAQYLDLSLEELKRGLGFTYDDPEDIKFEELIMYSRKVTLNNKELNSDFKEQLLELVDSIVSPTNESQLETMVIEQAAKIKESYQSLQTFKKEVS